MAVTCPHPNVVFDSRNDNGWLPPRRQTRPRCTVCGWQGSWRFDDEDTG